MTLFDIVQLFRIVIVIKIVDRKFISLSEHIENLLNSDKATCVGNICTPLTADKLEISHYTPVQEIVEITSGQIEQTRSKN